MAGIYGIGFKEIIIFQALIGLVRMQGCELEKQSVVTAQAGGDVVFLSGPYRSFHDLAEMRFESTGRYRLVAHFEAISRYGLLDIFHKAPNISLEVDWRDRFPEIHIRSISVTMPDISEADSGVYTWRDIYRPVVLQCWTLYVLGEGKYGTRNDYIEEGTHLNLSDFNHLSEEAVQRLNASTSWQIQDQAITQQSGYAVNITRSMNNKSLIYTIEGQNHNAVSVSYILNISYIGPVVFEPNRTSYKLPLDEALQSTTCVAACNPTCIVIWKRGNGTVSETNILGLDAILLRTAEYTCHVSNTETGKHLNKSYEIYFEGDRELTRTDSGDSRTLVYVFASLMAVSVLITAALTVRLCRHNIGSLGRPAFLRRAPQTDAVEMGADNVVANVPDGSTDRPSATYQDLQTIDGQENMYDGISTEVQQDDDRKNTYENMF